MFVEVCFEVTRDEFLRVVDTKDFDVPFLLIKEELMVVLQSTEGLVTSEEKEYERDPYPLGTMTHIAHVYSGYTGTMISRGWK